MREAPPTLKAGPLGCMVRGVLAPITPADIVLESGYTLEWAGQYAAYLQECHGAARTQSEREITRLEMRRHAREVAFDSPARLAEALNPEWETAWHLELISDTIKRCRHERVNAIIEAPVRHGKSELVSAHAPSYYLEHHPDHKVIESCHTQDLSNEWSLRNRDNIEGNPELFTCRVRSDARKVHDWRTTLGGGFFAVGAGGSPTGKGAHLLLVDDPIKNAEQAFSPAYRKKFREWWQMTMRTRLNTSASVVIIQARWCEEDLAGWLMEYAEENPLATQWEQIRLPARAQPTIAESEAEGFDQRKWRDPIGRKLNEPLWPSMWPDEELTVAEADVGRLSWMALYMADPVDEEGGLFSREDWEYVDPWDVPDLAAICRKWDLAATEEEGSSDPDYTVGALIGRCYEGYTYVLDIVRFREGPGKTDELIKATAELDGYDVPISFDQDPGSAGKRDANYLARLIVPGHSVSFEAPRGKRMARGLAGQQQRGAVRLVRADWNTELVSEFKGFPNAKHDDIVDAVSAGFANTIDAAKASASSAGSSEMVRNLAGVG